MKQLTVIVNDTVGKLSEVSYILGKSRINIDSISVGKVGDKGIINLVVKNENRASSILMTNGFKCLKSDVIVVKLTNEPGELAKLTRILSENKINVNNLTTVTQGPKYSLYSLDVNKHAKAEKLLAKYRDIERV